MKVIVADRAGVCFGVKRALAVVESESGQNDRLVTLGPLIHNPQVVAKLEESGVRVVGSVEEANGAALVIPSHGVPQEVYRQAAVLGLKVIDVTCPFVAKVLDRVRALSESGYEVAIVGDAEHLEVKAILSAAGGGAVVVSSADQARSVDWSGKRVGIVSQTTQIPAQYGEVVGVIAAQAREVVAHNTICYATAERQEAARALAPEVDAVFVVGGRNSANTNRLAEICGESGVPTYHIETVDEIRSEWVQGMQTVGLTAGASTPDWIIDEVKQRLETL